jgi:membrane associated rhomboid family serine protease
MATIALHTLYSHRDLIAYAQTAGPYLASIAVMPTIASAAAAEPLPPWPQLPISHDELLRNFTHTSGDAACGRGWTSATCLLAHTDHHHRVHNLLGLAVAGWRPARALGAQGFALTFVGGGVAAALNSAGREVQVRNWLDNGTRGWASYVTPRMAKLWNENGAWRLCGASAGVFALLGVDLCLSLEQARELLTAFEVATEEERPQLLGSLLWLGAAVAQTLSHVLHEHRALARGASVSVSHVGHLTGFAWGVGCWAVLVWGRKRARRRRANSAGRGTQGGGRRLGGR